MPIAKEIKIVKVPLSDKERLPDYPQHFPRMPRLYLELLENKSKIKQDLINKEYVPSDTNLPSRHTEETKDREKKTKKESPDSPGSLDGKSVSISDSDEEERSEKVSREKVSRESEKSDGESIDENNSESDGEKVSRKKSDDSDDDVSDDLSVRLKELLGDTDDEKSSRSRESHSVRESPADKYDNKDKQSVESRASKYTSYETYKDRTPAPTLAELEAKGQYQGKSEMRDINHITTGEYDQEDKKRELIFKFDLLKKSYPQAVTTVPEYTIYGDLYEMQKSYDDTVRRLSLDSTVESYKTYMIWGFTLVEYSLGNFLGFDMQGFTQQQIINMHSYEKLLIELGEKSYVPSGSRWPVELRLVFIIIMNAGFFIVSKMIMRKTGANLMGMMNSMNTPQNTQQTTAPPRPKRRMRGPNINLDDIPDVTETQADHSN